MFSVALEHSAEVLSRVPKHKRAAMGVMEKIHVLDKLHSGAHYSVMGYEFNVNEPTISIK